MFSLAKTTNLIQIPTLLSSKMWDKAMMSTFTMSIHIVLEVTDSAIRGGKKKKASKLEKM